MSNPVDDGPVLAAELRVVTADFRLHALDCRQCARVMRDAGGGQLWSTSTLCVTGQRMHGLVLGHRARVATAANGGRPTLRLVRGAA